MRRRHRALLYARRLADWKSHGSQYYNCSKYNDAAEPNKADARKALERYLHYFTRYENHQKSLKLERELFERIKTRIEAKVYNHEGTWIDWQYLYDAALLLTRCRYTLQYTYPYAYYMDIERDSSRKELVGCARRLFSICTTRNCRRLV